MQRELLEGLLRSEFGEQRLVRGPNHFSRVNLVPREPLFQDPPVFLHWTRSATELVIDAPPEKWPVVHDSVTLLRGRHVMKPGAAFTVGATRITFEETRSTWPVDLSREAQLLESPPEAWAVFADELMGRGDPLGAVVSRSQQHDIAYLVEVAPLVASKKLFAVAGRHGEWRELTFKFDFRFGAPTSAAFEAVLTHPVAWFVRQVTLDVQGIDGASAQQFLDEVARSSGPHLRRVVVLRLRAAVKLTLAREGVTLVR